MASLPERFLKHLKNPAVTAAAVALGTKVGKEAIHLQSGDINWHEFKKRVGSHVGSMSGPTIGATAGSLVGGWIPGVGSVFGAFVGGMIGQMAGEHIGRMSATRMEQALKRNEGKEVSGEGLGNGPVNGSDEEAEKSRYQPPKRDL